jgi:hypothetical protein
MKNIRHQLDQYGHLAVPLPTPAGERAVELLAGVSELLRRPHHLSALAELADAWASSRTERATVTWGRRSPDATRDGESHLQTVPSFARYVDADPRTPALLRAVAGRVAMFGRAADRLLDRLAAPAHCTVRAHVYEPDSSVPTHVDDSAVTVVFTDQPGSLLLASAGRRDPVRVAASGWHAVVLPGARSSVVFPGLEPSPHAATPIADRRRSITVFAG